MSAINQFLPRITYQEEPPASASSNPTSNTSYEQLPRPTIIRINSADYEIYLEFANKEERDKFINSDFMEDYSFSEFGEEGCTINHWIYCEDDTPPFEEVVETFQKLSTKETLLQPVQPTRLAYGNFIKV